MSANRSISSQKRQAEHQVFFVGVCVSAPELSGCACRRALAACAGFAGPLRDLPVLSYQTLKAGNIHKPRRYGLTITVGSWVISELRKSGEGWLKMKPKHTAGEKPSSGEAYRGACRAR